MLQLGKSKSFRWVASHFLPRYLLRSGLQTSVCSKLPIATDIRKSSKSSPKYCYYNHIITYRYCTPSEGIVDKSTFEAACTETLDSLTEQFEELVEATPLFRNGDVTYSDGVLTVYLGKSYGTYVINRQSPNLQIWLSSPVSGPKRYDFLNGTWIYKHNGTSLHSLLDEEIGKISKENVQFAEKCSFGKSSS